MALAIRASGAHKKAELKPCNDILYMERRLSNMSMRPQGFANKLQLHSELAETAPRD